MTHEQNCPLNKGILSLDQLERTYMVSNWPVVLILNQKSLKEKKRCLGIDIDPPPKKKEVKKEEKKEEE